MTCFICFSRRTLLGTAEVVLASTRPCSTRSMRLWCLAVHLR